MKFSIIIPAHNAAEHIQNALDSVTEQTFTDYELIVICDSCTDNTEQIAKEYGAITEKVAYHCDGPTRSRGLDIAKGDWILFMDDDDWWLHEYVLEQINSKLTDAIDGAASNTHHQEATRGHCIRLSGINAGDGQLSETHASLMFIPYRMLISTAR